MAEIKTIDKDMVMPVVAPNNTVGRPVKYETHVLPRIAEIEQWVREGYTDYSIADSLGICHATLIEYKKSCIELIEAYTRARTSRNNLVMNAQYEKAKGIKEKVPKAFKLKEIIYDDKGKKQSEIERLEYGEEYIYIPPDVQAADLFLRNNDPDYKGPKSVDSGAGITVNFQLPEARAKVEQLLSDRQKARAIDITGLEVVEAE